MPVMPKRTKYRKMQKGRNKELLLTKVNMDYKH